MSRDQHGDVRGTVTADQETLAGGVQGPVDADITIGPRYRASVHIDPDVPLEAMG